METEREPRFYTEYVHDKTLQREFLRASTHLNRVTVFLNLFLTGILVWFFFEMNLILDGTAEFCHTVIFLTILYLVIEVIRHISHLGGGIHYKRMTETNGGKPPKCAVQFYEDRILSVQLDTGNKNPIAYEQIKAIYETKTLFLLALKYRLFLIVDKQNLTGNREDFIVFLLDRCTKIKKIRDIRAGQIVSTIKWVVILTLFILAVVMHPGLQLKERLNGQIHNGMEVSGILSELEDFGITCKDSEILESMYGSTFFHRGSKLESILHYMGTCDYDYGGEILVPPESGVCFFYHWAVNKDTMYTDILAKISALDPELLNFTNVTECVCSNDFVSVSFTLNNSSHMLHAAYSDRYDPQFFNELNEIIYTQTGKGLYFTEYDGIGYFLFYRDSQWAEQFSDRTGLKLADTLLAFG